jgi:tetratricopeptide (TPR) repeat protein
LHPKERSAVAEADADYAAIATAVRNGDRPRAINLAARALKRGAKQPLVLVLAAEGLEERGQPQPAIDLLRAATAAAPQHRVAWMRLAALLARRKAFGEALSAFEAALKVEPDSYPALMGAGEMSLLLNDIAAAEGRYRRASEVEPGAAAPLAVLAVIAAQARDPALARDYARRANALGSSVVGAEMAIARADLLEGDPAAAEARLLDLLARPDLDDDNRAGALDIRAEARDALDRPSDAFADYEARNGLLLQVHRATFDAEAQRSTTIARWLATYLRAAPDEPWRTSPGEDQLGAGLVRSHVFLLGFPRSGTTLLEKALEGHPDIVAMEEINHLARAASDLRADAESWDRLANLTPADADARRRAYWDGVRETLGPDVSGRILVDKLPLHTLALPVISKLFPGAKILFAVRDPRDVVLSCYRRRFQINKAMFEFLTLDGAADFYDAVFDLAAVARAKLPLDIREVRHEAIVANFDTEVAELLAFVGAGWSPEVRTFSDRVAGRPRTPSYPQLARGLNADGVGQWRRYSRQIAPILPRLAPWVERLGYPAD